MLKEARVSQDATFAEIERKFKKDPAFTVVEAGRREILFSAYIRALTEKQAQLTRKAEKNLRVNEDID